MMDGILIYAFAAAVLGGLESPAGAVVGGLAIGVTLNLLGSYVGWVTPQLLLPAAFVLMLVVLLVKPSGLFGRTRVRQGMRPRALVGPVVVLASRGRDRADAVHALRLQPLAGGAGRRVLHRRSSA